MRPLPAVERFIERLFERPSARFFGTRVHPVQLLRRVERAMERARRAEGGRTLVPDRFTIRLHGRDLGLLDPDERLPVELASDALAFARRHGYVLLARPSVALEADPAVAQGEVDVQALFTESPRIPESGGPDVDASRTRAFLVPPVPGPRATVLVHEPKRPSRTIELGAGNLTIGRGDENGLVLADPAASRAHARLAARDGLLILTDLGSTNGTRVNGHAIRVLAVGEGDEIRIGSSLLVIAAVAEEAPADRSATGGSGPPATGG